MYLYRPNFFIHRSIVLVQVSFVFVHITPVCIQRGRARSVSYLKQNNKKNVRLLSLLWRFECVMIFYLYFCTKSIEKKKEGGRFFFFFFRRVGSLQHCCLDLHWCFSRAERGRGGGFVWHNLTSQCLQYLPTCFLMAQWLQLHQRSKQSATEAPSLSGDCVSSTTQT